MKARIKQLRKKLGLTQQTFADRIRVKRNTVATYEMGRNAPTDAIIELICREFNVNEEWLRTGKEPMFNTDPQDEIQALIDKYHLDDSAKIMITKFIELPPEDRQAVIRFAESMAETFAKKKNSSPPSPQEDKEEQYKKELSGIASTEDSSASNIIDATVSK